MAAREYDGYFGRTTIAATVADFYGWDLVVHGSDVARATGQEWSVSDAEAADLHATADGWGAALHSEGVCAPAVEVGADASATDRLLARLGRDPGWRPSVGLRRRARPRRRSDRRGLHLDRRHLALRRAAPARADPRTPLRHDPHRARGRAGDTELPAPPRPRQRAGQAAGQAAADEDETVGLHG